MSYLPSYEDIDIYDDPPYYDDNNFIIKDENDISLNDVIYTKNHIKCNIYKYDNKYFYTKKSVNFLTYKKDFLENSYIIVDINKWDIIKNITEYIENNYKNKIRLNIKENKIQLYTYLSKKDDFIVYIKKGNKYIRGYDKVVDNIEIKSKKNNEITISNIIPYFNLELYLIKNTDDIYNSIFYIDFKKITFIK